MFTPMPVIVSGAHALWQRLDPSMEELLCTLLGSVHAWQCGNKRFSNILFSCSSCRNSATVWAGGSITHQNSVYINVQRCSGVSITYYEQLVGPVLTVFTCCKLV